MSYQVIARKYRPQRFADVVGQEHVTQTLSRAIEQMRIAHAYIFCGPRGTGKTTVARIFAKCLNCTGGPKVDFDLDDPRCKEIAEGRALDVLEIDGASNNGVEQVRELRETCKYAPASSKFKIYIIDEVHMLSTAAFNALLKTLEEPPEHVKFMFATTDPEKVLPTILSRCQRFDLRRIPAALIAKHLEEIAGKENVTIDPAALYAIARGAEGAMRDAESTLDQLISFCGDKIEEADVLSMFGLTAQKQLLDLSSAVLSGEVQTALRQLNDLASGGKDLGRLLSDLLNQFRNMLIYRVSGGDLSMLEISEAEAAALAAQSRLVTPEGLTRVLEVFADAEMRLRDASSKKILIEVALLKAIEARNAVSLDSVLAQLENLRDGTAAVSTAGAARPSAESHAAAPRKSAPVPASAPATPTSAAAYAAIEEPKATFGAPSSTSSEKTPPAPVTPAPAAAPTDLFGLWTQIVETVGRHSPFTKTYLDGAHPVSFANNVFTIGFGPDSEDHIGLVDNARNQALLKKVLAELGHAEAQFKFIKARPPAGSKPGPSEAPAPVPSAATPAPAPAAPEPPAPAPTAQPKAGAAPSGKAAAKPAAQPKTTSVPFNKDDFKNDPLIQKALEIFKGQIVDVRT
jgi:DNA polymerase-3 subunit gamma/tau